MNGMSLVRRAALLVIGAAFAAGAPAQTLDFGSCVRIDDAGARLACYDRAAGRPASPRPAAAPAASAPPAPRAPAGDIRAPVATPSATAPVPAMPRDPVAGFGAEKAGDDLTAPKANAKAKPADKPIQQIEARVTAVRKRPEGQQVLTLENGQVWEQNEVQREPQFQVGDVVVIRRGMLGSFLLTLQKGSATTRVRRIS